MDKTFVIYKAVNLINGKIYIGKTYNFEKRKREHSYDIDNGLPFHKALKKYGMGNFSWEIIDTATSDAEARQKEIKWIKKMNTCILSKNSNGYNITLGGEGGVSWNSRPIVQFTLEGEYVDEYLSCACAANLNGFDRKSIERVAKNQRGSSNGFQWRYKADWNGDSIEKYVRGSEKRKRVLQLDLYGNIVGVYESIIEASKKTGLGRCNISNALIGRVRTCGGYQWLYAKDYNPSGDYRYGGMKIGEGIVQLTRNRELIQHFNNCSEAARCVGFPEASHKMIHKALNSKSHYYKGFIWMKKEDYDKATKLFP